MRIGLIAGTGAGLFNALGDAGELAIETPFSNTAVAVTTWQVNSHEVLFIPRHGADSQIPPHRVNYRANIAALKLAGVQRVIALNAVGTINDAGGAPGTLALPDQLIDYTSGREHTFYDGMSQDACKALGLPESLQHVEFTRPLNPVLRDELLQAAQSTGIEIAPTATCGVMQGPRLESAAEIDRLERDGCHIVGMTHLPEAGLAAEAGLAYASIAGNVNFAAGRAPVSESGEEQGIHDQIGEYVERCMSQSHTLLNAWLAQLPVDG